MKRIVGYRKEGWYCLLSILLSVFLFSCKGVYTIQGKVLAINGEPLPGVCVSSPEILEYTVTNARGTFVLHLHQPVSTLEFIKSDYLPYTVSLHSMSKDKINLPEIFLTPKPFVPGVYFLEKEKNRYIPFTKGKIERIQVANQNFVPSIKLKDLISTFDTYPSIYIFRLPQYDITVYQMKEYQSKKEESSDKKMEKSAKKTGEEHKTEQPAEKIVVPDAPILVHTELLSEADTSLFVVKPVNELKPGIYCVNWRAFESLFPRINDCFLFEVKSNTISDNSLSAAPSSSGNQGNDTKNSQSL